MAGESGAARALVGAIQKFSTEDGPGIRTTVFLKGCPLNCQWCHNPEMIAFEQQLIQMPNSCIGCGYCLTHCPRHAVSAGADGAVEIDRQKCDRCMQCTEFCYAKALQPVARAMTAEEVMAEVAQDKGFYDQTGGGMTISGGELLSHAGFAAELVEWAEREGIRVCLDTSGFGDGETLRRLAGRDAVTHVLFDVKAVDGTVHRQYTGQSNAVILENLALLAADAVIRAKIQLRMPLIRGVNDSDAAIGAAAALYRRLGLRTVTLLPYHSLGVSKARNTGGTPVRFEPPSEARLGEIQAYLESEARMQVERLGLAKTK